MLYALRDNNTWDNKYRFKGVNSITEDYEICGKALMGRSGYLQQK